MTGQPGCDPRRDRSTAPGWPLAGLEAGLWILIGLGMFLRVSQYLANRSLWIDECFLASNVIHRSFVHLFTPLEHNQVAPPGFLAAQWLACRMFGPSEYALRAVPLLGGLVSLVLFKWVSQSCLDRVAVPIALGLFALSDHLIYYASEAKQYSTDVAIALSCWLLYARGAIGPLTPTRGLLLGAWGGVAVWFAHPAVFVLLGVSTALGLDHLGRSSRERRALGLLGFTACWAASFALLHAVSLRSTAGSEFLRFYWRHGFMPFPPTTLSQALWPIWALKSLIDEALGQVDLPFPIIALAVGAAVLWRHGRGWFTALALACVAALGASALGRYPFTGRLVLFLVPW